MATIADELNAISVEHGYTGAAPKTIAGAIDALADTLAGTDVEERRTIAGAVKALAPYIGSGGGGTTLGALQMIPVLSNNAPIEVGNHFERVDIGICELYVGLQIVLNNSVDNLAYVDEVAAGTTVVMKSEGSLDNVESIGVFLVTFDDDGRFSTVEPFDLDVSIDVEHDVASWVMPVWDATEGQTPVMHFNYAI